MQMVDDNVSGGGGYGSGGHKDKPCLTSPSVRFVAGCSYTVGDRRKTEKTDRALIAGRRMQRIELVCTPVARLRGLLFRAPDNVTRVLIPCSAIHTFGMRHAIDVAFIDGSGCVIGVFRNVSAYRRLYCREAAATVERFAQKGRWLACGDRLCFVSSALSSAPLRSPHLPQAFRAQ